MAPASSTISRSRWAGPRPKTSMTALGAGQFGMAEETATELNRAISDGVGRGLGIGQAVGRYLVARQPPHGHHSLALAAARLEIPLTVHVAIGTDIIHMHPARVGRSARRRKPPRLPLSRVFGRAAVGRRLCELRIGRDPSGGVLESRRSGPARGSRSRRPDDRQHRLHRHYRPITNVVIAARRRASGAAIRSSATTNSSSRSWRRR